MAYLIFVALFSGVGLAAEYAIGRRARTGTLGSYKNAWATRGKVMGKAGGLLGFGLFMEPIFKWGPWMDIVSIYIIPIGATLGAISWFWIMKKDDLLFEINKGGKKPLGNLWYCAGRYLYVPAPSFSAV